MDKNKIIKEIYEKKIIAIFRGINATKCADAVNALCNGGITMAEVTFDPEEISCAYKNTVESIHNIAALQKKQIFVGAGTVIRAEQVVLAYNAGAQYIITPNTDREIISLAKKLGMVVISGAYTATEVNEAYNAGADFVKIFPAAEAGSSYFRAIRGPLSHIPLIAVGGIDTDNARAFLDAGAIGIGIGSNLVDKKLIEKKEYAALTALAQKYVESIK